MISCSTCQKGLRIKRVGDKYTNGFVYALVDGKLHYFCNETCQIAFEQKGGTKR